MNYVIPQMKNFNSTYFNYNDLNTLSADMSERKTKRLRQTKTTRSKIFKKSLKLPIFNAPSKASLRDTYNKII